MSPRQLASEAGLQVGSLSNHISTKQQLLLDLIDAHMKELLVRLDDDFIEIIDPVNRLRAFIDFHLRYHMKKKSEISVVDLELRSLESSNHGDRGFTQIE